MEGGEPVTFEVFHRPRAARGPMLVTVQENGALRLNSSAYRAIDQPTYVLLLHDRPRAEFAIRPVASSSEYTFRAGGAGFVSCVDFIRFMGLVPGRYPAHMDGELLVVDMLGVAENAVTGR